MIRDRRKPIKTTSPSPMSAAAASSSASPPAAWCSPCGLPRASLRGGSQEICGATGMPHGFATTQVFVAIDPYGPVTIVCHRSEMGQGVRTSLPMIVADELEADWSRVKVAQAPGDEARYGNQDTDGSRSTRHHFHAAAPWPAPRRAPCWSRRRPSHLGVPATRSRRATTSVIDAKSGKQDRLRRGRRGGAPSCRCPPRRPDQDTSRPSRFRYIGKGELGIVDNMDITTGKTHYGIDTRLDGMKYAVVARAPVYGGTVMSYDAAEALKGLPGVRRSSRSTPRRARRSSCRWAASRSSPSNTWAAIQGREKLKSSGTTAPTRLRFGRQLQGQLLEAAARKPGKVVRNEGDVGAAMGKAARKIEAEYYVPHLAHASMEPPAATARIVDGKCEAWACVQIAPGGARPPGQALGLGPENVTVHVTLLGGGFGRKSKPDYVAEAGLLSKAMDGAPVKVTWTREDRSAARLSALGIGPASGSRARTPPASRSPGCTAASSRRSARPSRRTSRRRRGRVRPGPGQHAVRGRQLGSRTRKRRRRRASAGSARSTTSSTPSRSSPSRPSSRPPAGRDQKDYLLELIGPVRKIDPAKLHDWNHGEDPAVYQLDTGASRRRGRSGGQGAGWGRPVPKGSGLGIAGHYSFMTYVAAAIEVKVDKGQFSIPRVDIAIDCGPQVNPERIRAQLQGATIMGISVATLGEITFKEGRVEQAQLRQLRGDPHRRRAARDQRASDAGRGLRPAARRRRRARRAADRTGPVQRDLRGDRQADPAAADPGSAVGLSSKSEFAVARLTPHPPDAAQRDLFCASPLSL